MPRMFVVATYYTKILNALFKVKYGFNFGSMQWLI